MIQFAHAQKFKEFYSTHPKLKEWLYYGDGDDKAFCKCCKVSIICKLSHLLAHVGDNHHVLAYKSFTSNRNNTTNEKEYVPAHLYQDRDGADNEHLIDISKIDTMFKIPRAGFRYSGQVKDLYISKCLEVISLAKCHKKVEIARRTNLIVPIIEGILNYEEHIHTILKYVPNAMKFITPYKLNNIIAITEILKEFMSRLMRLNAQITDEELMLNADMLIRVFGVTDIKIDEKWALFFRNNFQQSNSIEKPIQKPNKYDFYVRNILSHIQHRLDSAVVTHFNERLKSLRSLSLVCNEMFGKEYVEEDEIDHTESAKTSQTGSDEQLLYREKEIEECMTNVNANEMLNDEPQEVSICVKNEAEEFIPNDDSNETIEIYAVIDEDEDDNNQNLMVANEQTDVTIPIVSETQNAMHEEYCIKQEYENPEFTAKETELALGKIKETNINTDNNDTYEIYAVIDADNDDDDHLINLDEEMQTTAYETQYKVDQEYCRKQENSHYTDTKGSLHKRSQELNLDQIKENTIEIDSNCNIKEEEEEEEEEEEVYEESQASVPHFSLELMKSEIKQELDDTYSENTENNEIYGEMKEFEEPKVKQSPMQISCIEPEIKQEPIEINAEHENYIDQEIFQEPPSLGYLLQQKYIMSTEHEIKQEPVDDILDPHHVVAIKEYESLKNAPFKNLNAGVNDSLQFMEHKIDEAPNEKFTSNDIMHSDTATTLKHDAHLTEQRALEIGRIFYLKLYGQLSCETLSLDPIICTYMQILSNQPLQFSETALRKAFQIVLGEELYNCQYQYNIQTEDLELYRQCILLVYSEKNKLCQLKVIMKDIFSEFEIKIILRNSHNILEEWRTFFNKHFISTLYTKAVYEILFEYRARYCLISAVLDQDAIKALPQATAKDIQKFLSSDFELVQYWQQGYKEYIKKKVNKTPNDFCRLYTINDLSLNCIYEDIKELLPQLVVMYLCYAREESDYLSIYSDDSKSLTTAIDSHNKNMNMDSNHGKAAFDKNVQNRQQITSINKRAQNENVYSKRKNIPDLISKISQTSTEEQPNKKQKTNQFMPEIVCKNLNDMQSMTTSRESDISAATDLSHNTAEPIEIANIYKIQTWQKSNFICTLRNDPIVNLYLLLSRLSYGRNLPVFSNQILRKAFGEVFKENYAEEYSMCPPKDLQLYSKLLLLFYSDHIKYRKRLADIMICFDKSTIEDHLANASNIITEWRAFFQKNISRILYKQAVYEMLYEYTLQCLRQENYISDEELIHNAEKIQRFLRCQIILPKAWLKYFSALFEKRFRFHNCPTRTDLFNRVHIKLITLDDNLTENKMSLCSIYESIKHRLNYLVTDTLLNEKESIHAVDAENSSIALEISNNGNKATDKKSEESMDAIIEEYLEKDTIIMNYFQHSNAQKSAGTKLPVFVENQLYSSFSEVTEKYEGMDREVGQASFDSSINMLNSLEKKQIFKNILDTNPFSMSEGDFMKAFHISKEFCRSLIDELQPYDAQKTSTISFSCRFMAAIYYFAQGNNMLVSIDNSTTSESLHQITQLIINRKSDEIRFPLTVEELSDIKTGFRNCFGITNTIGAIGYTSVAIVEPTSNEYQDVPYADNEEYCTAEVEAACDHRLCFLAITAEISGFLHPCEKWASSDIRLQMMKNHISLQNTWLLGDHQNYPLEPWLLTPISHPSTTREKKFNSLQTEVRKNTIERAFRVLKSRFQCLFKDRGLRFDRNKAINIIYACAILHNIIIKNDAASDFYDTEISSDLV